MKLLPVGYSPPFPGAGAAGGLEILAILWGFILFFQ